MKVIDRIRLNKCLRLLLEVTIFQQELLRDISDNQGISFGMENEDKLEQVSNLIDSLKIVQDRG